MTTLQISNALQRVVAEADSAAELHCSDRRLMELFAREHCQSAFAAIVWRHRGLVMSVCRRNLSNEQDAEDAFQVTFLLLARKAAALRAHPCIRAWLYETAFRTASKIRVGNARRRRREQRAAECAAVATETSKHCEASAQLESELARLPASYRMPLWLCYWEGRSQSEAADELGWSLGQLRGMLHRARKRLRKRLRRRGLTSLALLSPAATDARDAVSASLVNRTTEAATCVLLNRPWNGPVSQTVQRLVNGGIASMASKSIATITTVLFALGILGTSVIGQPSPAADRPTEEKETPRVVATDEDQSEWQDLIKHVDPEKHVIGKGIWRIRDGKLFAYPAPHGSRLRIPIVPTGAYEIRAKWEMKGENGSAMIILPHGERTASVELDDRLQCSGLGDLNGVRPDVNETKKALDLKVGKVYDVHVKVNWTDRQFHVEASLDGKTFLDWEGKRSEVHHEFYAPPKPYSLGLAIGGQPSVIHSLQLHVIKGKAESWKPRRAEN